MVRFYSAVILILNFGRFGMVFGLRRAMVPAIVSSSTLIECELFVKTSQIDNITG